MTRILIGCPTHISKAYAEDAWSRAVDRLLIPDGWETAVACVDNSPEPRDLPFSCLWMDPGDFGPNRRIAASMELLRNLVISGSYDYWFNLEIDVIVPPDALKILFHAASSLQADWVSHYYPQRGHPEEMTSGFGCSLFSRRLLESCDFQDAPEDTTTDGWWWNTKVKRGHWRIIELWNVVPGARHLDG